MPTTWTDALLDELSRQGDPAVDEIIHQHADAGRHRHRPAERCCAAWSSTWCCRPSSSHRRSPPTWPSSRRCRRGPTRRMLERAATFFADEALDDRQRAVLRVAARGLRVGPRVARAGADRPAGDRPVRRVYETAEMILHSMARHGLQPADVATTVEACTTHRAAAMSTSAGCA